MRNPLATLRSFVDGEFKGEQDEPEVRQLLLNCGWIDRDDALTKQGNNFYLHGWKGEGAWDD